MNPGAGRTIRRLKGADFIVALPGGGYVVGNALLASFIRLTPKGHLDASFGKNGVTRLRLNPTALVARPDGKLLIVGDAPPRDPGSDADSVNYIVRLDAAGRIDQTFGDAGYHGSLGNRRLWAPIVAIAGTRKGRGYWLLGADGGVFSFGEAAYRGSASAHRLHAPVIAMASTATGNGYWLLGADGGVFTFGDAVYRGSIPGFGKFSVKLSF